MAEHPDAQRFREGLERASPDLFADDVVWHGAADGGEASGNDEAAKLLAGAGGDTPALAVKDMYADGAHTVAWLERSANGNGRLAHQ